MEFDGGIAEFLKAKCILVTGSTGFLAKIFVEKVLRVQPDVKKIYLLLRASDADAAADRLGTDITGKELFRLLREKHGGEDGYQALVTDKLVPVPGDIAMEDLGVRDLDLRQQMWSELDVVVNVAATTNFYERYDVAMRINVLGAKHILEFARRCSNLQMLLHVSTAYVSVKKEGLILEKKFQMGETMNGTSCSLDIDAEVRLMEDKLQELRRTVTKEDEKIAMKELGFNRARHFGWPNVYVFTKAMGEMLLGHKRGDMPLVIIRPSIVTSVYSDPVPGWIEGLRQMDSLIVGYGMGKVPCFLGDYDTVLDVIPGDMVVNAMIMAMVAHANQPSEYTYHVCSSVRNPMTYRNVLSSSRTYFARNPQVDVDGKAIETKEVSFFPDVQSFQRYMTLRFKLPLEGLRLANSVTCRLFSQYYNHMNKKYNFVMRFAKVYESFVLFKGRFDDRNLERLRVQMENNKTEKEMFKCDPKSIDWTQYLTNIHIDGLLKYAVSAT